MKQQGFSVKKRIRSFGYALNGLKTLVREEPNAKIHLFVTVFVVIAGVVFQVSVIEWIAIVFAVGFVIALEAINTSIENISDFISPEKHNWIKKIKDVSAAGVLVAAITAVIVGFIVFIPKIWDLFF